MAELPRVHRDEVEGIPVIWCEDTVPFGAGIEFRVARCDETLVDGGITHLVEHLALPTRRRPRVDFNGAVEGAVTSFWATGARERVLDLLREIARTLADPPLDRLEIERETLLTEAEGFGSDPRRLSAMLRFGPTGHGLVGYSEYGLHRLRAEQVGTWTASRFVRENAAVRMNGAPPDELGLELPSGVRHAAVEPRPIPYLRWPCAYEYGPPGVVSLSYLAERSYETTAVLRILEARLFERLRFSAGLSYGVHWMHEPLTREVAHVVIWADTRSENATRVRDGLRGTVDELAEHGPTAEELAEDLDELIAAATEPGFVTSAVTRGPRDELLGNEFQDVGAELARLAAITPESTAAALRRGLETLLVVLPGGVDRGSLDPYPMEPPVRVEGAKKRPRGLRARLRRADRWGHLVVGAEGVARITPAESLAIRFDECAALLRWTDGRRALWSRDGFYLELVPDEWQDGSELAARIDAAVPPERVVPMEPSLETLLAEVGEALEGKVKRGFTTSNEIDALPGLLADGERLTLASRADIGWRAGLLAVTDRRVLFVYLDDVRLDLPLDSVRSATTGKSMWSGSRIVVETGDGTHTFTNVPDDRVDEVAAALRPA